MTGKYSSLEQEHPTSTSSVLRGRLDKFLRSWYSTLVIFCLLLVILLLLLWVMFPQDLDRVRGKRGAGLLFVADQQVLLLLRNSQHNNRTWGLPGGNAEAKDADTLATAVREATEELGDLPDFTLLTEITTKRGKRDHKLYTVFVCNSSSATNFIPKLNHEHHAYKWFDLKDALQLENLHPVVSILFKEPARKKLLAAVTPDRQTMPNLIENKVVKRGAELFLMSDELEILLLTRNSKNNNNTLSCPGGNVEPTDTDLLATANREAVEEMGSIPEHEIRGNIDITREGKKGEKEFRLYLGAVSSSVRASFVPILNKEHSAWNWYPLAELLMPGAPLHPVVQIALRDHLQDILLAFSLPQEPIQKQVEELASSISEEAAVEQFIASDDSGH